MPELTEEALRNDLIVAQRARIAELELQLRNARAAARVAGAELRAILAGCASTEEQMRASIAYQPVIAALAEISIEEHRPAPVRYPPTSAATAYPVAGGGKVLDLGTRIKRRTQFYAGLATLEPVSPREQGVRTSANPSESKDEEPE